MISIAAGLWGSKGSSVWVRIIYNKNIQKPSLTCDSATLCWIFGIFWCMLSCGNELHQKVTEQFCFAPYPKKTQLWVRSLRCASFYNFTAQWTFFQRQKLKRSHSFFKIDVFALSWHLQFLLASHDLKLTSWWLNQPLWKIWSSKWESSPIFGMNIINIWVATT